MDFRLVVNCNLDRETGWFWLDCFITVLGA